MNYISVHTMNNYSLLYLLSLYYIAQAGGLLCATFKLGVYFYWPVLCSFFFVNQLKSYSESISKYIVIAVVWSSLFLLLIKINNIVMV